MSLPSKSHLARNIIAIVAVTLIAISAAGYAVFRGYNSGITSQQTQTTSTQSQVSQQLISGNDLTETIPVSTDSSVTISCNSCNITFNLNSGTTLNLLVSGNYNTATLNGGQTNLQVSGNYNLVNAQNTALLSNQNSGTGNTVN
jgi:hypothetical protein